MSDDHEHRDNALVSTACQLSAKTALVKRGIALTEVLLSDERAKLAKIRLLLAEARTWDGFTENHDEILKLLIEDSKQAAITGKYQYTLESAYRKVVGTEQPSTHRGRVVEVTLPDPDPGGVFSFALDAAGVVVEDALPVVTHRVIVGPVGIDDAIEAWGDVPAGGEWVLDWLKREGDAVTVGEPLAELRADGHTEPLPSPVDGVLVEIRAKHGLVELGSVVALVESSASVHRQRQSAAEQHQETEKHVQQTDVELVEDDRWSLEFEEISAEALAKQGEEAPVIKLVNVILMSAIEKGASDIYIEPTANELFVRYRIDGVLYDIMQPPLKFRDAITSCIKGMAKLDILETRLAQHGRAHVRLRNDGVTQDMELQVSCQPTRFGEDVRVCLSSVKCEVAATAVNNPWRKDRFRPAANAYPPSRTSSAPAPQGMEQHYYPERTTVDKDPSRG